MLTPLSLACASRARQSLLNVPRLLHGGAVAILATACFAMSCFAMSCFATSCSAHAHGIAGNRLFPGTLTFDDPAVNDELILPSASRFQHPGEGGDVVDSRFNWAFSRLLTPKIAIGAESGWIRSQLGQFTAVRLRHNKPEN